MIPPTLIQIGDTPESDIARPRWEERLERLREHLAALGNVVVAYSGGVDSSLLLRVAVDVLGDRALGVIGRSDSYAARELDLALAQAASFGARVEIVTTGELADPNFRSNPTSRCYHCKTELYRKLAIVAQRVGAAAILDGTIADDLSDWRPGRRAAAEHGVGSPLAELGFTKTDVRAAAGYFGLASRDKPASPCLASRVPYGTEITGEILRQIERGEQVLRELGFLELRVRYHGEIARIEVAGCDLPRFSDPALRKRVVEGLKAAGFRWVTLDLEGFRSGSLNLAAGSGGDALAISPVSALDDPSAAGAIPATRVPSAVPAPDVVTNPGTGSDVAGV